LALEARREVDALEFTRGGDPVVMGARSPNQDRGGRRAARGQIFNVFTLRGGRIVRIDDYRRRAGRSRPSASPEEAGRC